MPVTFDLAGTAAVVTGGGKGIGKAIAQGLLRSGARVWVWDLNPGDTECTGSAVVDITKPDQISAATHKTMMQTDRLDVLVNDAGYLGGYLPFEKLEHHDWRYILDVNLSGTMEVTRQLLPHLRRSN